MKRFNLIPHGFPCALEDCPEGPFLLGNTFGVKTEDGPVGLERGNKFRDPLADISIVQPCIGEWVDL